MCTHLSHSFIHSNICIASTREPLACGHINQLYSYEAVVEINLNSTSFKVENETRKDMGRSRDIAH